MGSTWTKINVEKDEIERQGLSGNREVEKDNKSRGPGRLHEEPQA